MAPPQELCGAGWRLRGREPSIHAADSPREGSRSRAADANGNLSSPDQSPVAVSASRRQRPGSPGGPRDGPPTWRHTRHLLALVVPARSGDPASGIGRGLTEGQGVSGWTIRAFVRPRRHPGLGGTGQRRLRDLLMQVLRSILDCWPRSMMTGTCWRTLPPTSQVSVQFSIRPGTSCDDTTVESNSVAFRS